MISDTLILFRKNLETLAKPQPGTSMEWWRHRNILREFNDRCAYCGVDLVRLHDRNLLPRREILRVEHLVARKHGGEHHPTNMVAACVTCIASKNNRDWLDWRHAPTEADVLALNVRRQAALETSHNHLLRNPNLGKKKETVHRHLAARWSHRRFTVFAALTDANGFVGWERNAAPVAEAIAVLIHYGARHTHAGIWHLQPSRFMDAIWQLIDLNAWVRRIQLPDIPDPTPDAPGDSQWHITHTNVHDIRRRRSRLNPKWIPPEERPMDWGKRLLIEYEASWKLGRPFDWGWTNKHKETDLAFERKRDAKRRGNQALLDLLDARLAREQQEVEARRLENLPLIDRFLLELDRRVANRSHSSPTAPGRGCRP